MLSCRPACIIASFNYLDNRNGIIPPARRSAEPFTNGKRWLQSKKMENGMLFDLRMRGGSRDRILFISQATLPTLIVLTTVSCSRPDMPQPRVGIFEPELFSGQVTEETERQLVQEDEAQPKIRRQQSKKSASHKAATARKVATVHTPKAPSPSASGSASKKAKSPPRPATQREQQLFQEFLEWRKQQNGLL
jgi:hypothetical protein